MTVINTGTAEHSGTAETEQPLTRRCCIQKTTYKSAAECIQCGTVYGPRSQLVLCKQCDKQRCHSCYTKVKDNAEHDECKPKTDEQARRMQQIMISFDKHENKAVVSTKNRGAVRHAKLRGKGEDKETNDEEGTETHAAGTGATTIDKAAVWERQEKEQFLKLAREVEEAGPTLGAVNTLAPSIWNRTALVVLKAIEEYCDAHLADRPDEEEIEAASLWLWIAVAAIAHPALKHAKLIAGEDVSDTAIRPTEDGPLLQQCAQQA